MPEFPGLTARRAIVSGFAVTALGAAAVGAGVLTQPAIPTPPATLAASDDNGDASAESIAILNSTIDPNGWEAIVGDGSSN